MHTAPFLRHRQGLRHGEGRSLSDKQRLSIQQLCHRMYTYFVTYDETGAPSFGKFARSVGLTREDLAKKRKNARFERAWRECNEIRRDYLIDCALTKRHDPTFVKFLLSERDPDEAGPGETGDPLTVTLEVVGEPGGERAE